MDIPCSLQKQIIETRHDVHIPVPEELFDMRIPWIRPILVVMFCHKSACVKAIIIMKNCLETKVLFNVLHDEI